MKDYPNGEIMNILLGKDVWFNGKKCRVYSQDLAGDVQFCKDGEWHSPTEYHISDPIVSATIKSWLIRCTGAKSINELEISEIDSFITEEAYWDFLTISSLYEELTKVL